MTQRTEPRPKRPVWVWAITAFYSFSALFALRSFLLVYSVGTGALPPEWGAYMGGLTVFDYLLSATIAALTLAAAAALFLLRGAAFRLFCAVLVLQVFGVLRELATTNFADAVGIGGLAGYLVALGLLAAVCAYCRRLLAAGVLR